MTLWAAALAWGWAAALAWEEALWEALWEAWA